MHLFYVSPKGNDQWSGTSPAPSATGDDGPFRTIARARDVSRERKRSAKLAGPVTVYLRGGRYVVREPIVFTPEDSYPTTYAAYRKEKPVLDGGEVLTRVREESHNGRRCWTVDLPEVRQGLWYFRSLYVNGQRRPRTRLPKTGYYQIADVPGVDVAKAGLFDGSSSFVAKRGDIRPFHNLSDVEILCHHFWVEERLPLTSFDPETDRVTSSRRPIFVLRRGFDSTLAYYCLENVFEAMEEAGEWYLDRVAGRLYYLPHPHEQLRSTELAAPRACQLLLLQGEPQHNRYVEFLAFRGLTFSHTDWRQPRGGAPEPDTPGFDSNLEYGADAQAALSVEASIVLVGARNCCVEDCTLSHLGGYGIEVAAASSANRVVGCEMLDLGGGGVKITGGNSSAPLLLRTGRNRVTDNHIHHIGEVFPPAIGVLSTHSFGNVIAHNHIHDTHYSGIAVGWVWGYGDTVSRDNHIECNHIHDIGRGLLSDMGGIYTLGMQPGTTIRHNLVHDVRAGEYGAFAIYADEGTSHVLIEGNVCYKTDSTVLYVHYGRENIVRNNIFAFGKDAIVCLGRRETHNPHTMAGNILVTAGKPIHLAGYESDFEPPSFRSDHNLLFDTEGKVPLGAAMPAYRGYKPISLKQLRLAGCEQHSCVADPGFGDLAKLDVSFRNGSPALAMGFHPIDLKAIGPRPAASRD